MKYTFAQKLGSFSSKQASHSVSRAILAKACLALSLITGTGLGYGLL